MMKDCLAFAPGQHGLNIPSFFDGGQVIENCQFDSCGQYGIYMSMASRKQIFMNLNNCWMDGEYGAVFFKDVEGMSITGGTYSVLNDNASLGDGIMYFEDSDFIRIVGARARNRNTAQASYPIYFKDVDYSTVAGCYVDAGTPTKDFCITEAGTSDSNNVFSGNTGVNWTTGLVSLRSGGGSFSSGFASNIHPIEHHTGSDTLGVAEAGTIHTNLGAGGAITLTLPQAVPTGIWYEFAVMAAQELRIDPGAAGAIYMAGAKADDDEYFTANAICDWGIMQTCV